MRQEVKCSMFTCDDCKKIEYLIHSLRGEYFVKPKGWGSMAAVLHVDVNEAGEFKRYYSYNKDFCEKCYPIWKEKQEVREVFK